jgi:hypothetical protein
MTDKCRLAGLALLLPFILCLAGVCCRRAKQVPVSSTTQGKSWTWARHVDCISVLDPQDCPLPRKISGQLRRLFGGEWRVKAQQELGNYLLITVSLDRADAPPLRALIVFDRQCNLCFKIVDARVGLYEPGLADLTGDGREEVILFGFSGGAHCCSTFYVCTLHPSFSMLGCIDGGNGDIPEVRDVDGDGCSEIVLWNDSFVYYDGLPFPMSPDVPMVVGCDHQGKLVEMTAKCPDFIRADIQKTKTLIRDEVGALPSGSDRYDEDACRSHVIRWFADAAMLGEEDKALREIARAVPPSVVEWLRLNIEEIASIVNCRAEKVSREALSPGGE